MLPPKRVFRYAFEIVAIWNSNKSNRFRQKRETKIWNLFTYYKLLMWARWIMCARRQLHWILESLNAAKKKTDTIGILREQWNRSKKKGKFKLNILNVRYINLKMWPYRLPSMIHLNEKTISFNFILLFVFQYDFRAVEFRLFRIFFFWWP